MSNPAGYRAVAPQVDLPAMEREVIALWDAQHTFEASLARTADGPTWTFYEGPPTANGMPGTHHIEARAFKDVFPRFKTMQGFRVDRKAGWDCHGLPVELAVEKELGFNGKPDIEAYGIAPFNERCRSSVTQYVDQWTELTRRMGYWVNLDEAYWTMNTSYVESVWWSLKQIHQRGLLVEDQRVAPYCPRCGTTLSDHELAQGYEETADTTVFVRFPLTSGPYAGTADLAIWTTTPWTLVSNTTVAVGPDIEYTVAVSDAGAKPVVVAVDSVTSALGEGWRPTDTFTGADMLGWTYERPLDVMDQPGPAWFVVNEDYVATGEGTGLVHQSYPFGEDDFASSRRNGIAYVNPIGPDGCFLPGNGFVSDVFFKTADPLIVERLRDTGLLLRTLVHEHPYPHCWRCHTPLMYYAQPSWYIRTTQVKEALLRENEATSWHPEHIKHGRYGDWLDNNIDWALSRKRYWGTPLPIWRCEDDHQVCVGSLAELGELAGENLSALDPHRPFVDDVTFACPTCGKPSVRVPEVIDAWYDSGSMPFAQWGYPWAPGSAEKLEQAYPADFICEAIDQTRGWFYSLMAVGTLTFDASSYRTVLCLGHILAEDGRKMSKHLGNILEPISLMDTHGADAVRWFMVAGGSPWSSRRVGHTTITETVRKVLLTYWNAVSFQSLYARTNGWTPAPPPADTTLGVLDRWLVSVRNDLVAQVTDALEHFDTQRAGSLLADFVDDLSNWYIRRSRRRFWEGDPGALWTLHETLDVVTRLMAPMAPFVTERVWQDLFVAAVPDAAASVHLASWPVADAAAIDPDLNASMRTARRLVELGRSARSEARVKTRQPLQRLLVPSASFARLGSELIDEIAAELNVGTVESFSSAGDLVDHVAKGNFRALGRRFGKDTPRIAAAIAAADAAALASALAAHGEATVDVDGGTVVSAEEVLISERPREGWSVVNEQGETVALDLELTPALVAQGLVREVVRLVQDARKASGLEVSDRIELVWNADAELAEALRSGADDVAREVLATTMTEGEPSGDVTTDDELGLRFAIRKA
ncbi:isoleucine--tRNA ligase [Propioniciclava soli]|uniref:Isoleucine--tRNA ligase n=1 Tax=Propioniciclava soli TaxID=2775081 RepID=A0ABZ3C9W9_9ACTN